MAMFEKIVALVPMRHHSVRVPGKNYRLLGGKPLFYHIIETLLACPEIQKVVIDTDSPLIQAHTSREFPMVEVLIRPDQLRADTVPMNDILLYDTSQVQADLYLQTHSTNPLVKAETLSRAIRVFEQQYPEHDSLFSVTRLQTRLWDASGKALNHDPNILLRTQDLPPVYEENSCFYLFTRKTLAERKNRLGYRPMLYEIPADEAWDIDEELDFAIVDFLLQHRK